MSQITFRGGLEPTPLYPMPIQTEAELGLVRTQRSLQFQRAPAAAD